MADSCECMAKKKKSGVFKSIKCFVFWITNNFEFHITYIYSNTHGSGGGLVTKSCPTLETSWTVACQAPLFMRFPR